MSVRHLRPKIYEPVRKGTVVLEDWPFVIVLALAGFLTGLAANFATGSRLPLPAIGLFIGAGVGIAFFNWTRRGKRRGFLQHLIADTMKGPDARGWLPDDCGDGRADYIIAEKRRAG
jgi:hypothetical protein